MFLPPKPQPSLRSQGIVTTSGKKKMEDPEWRGPSCAPTSAPTATAFSWSYYCDYYCHCCCFCCFSIIITTITTATNTTDATATAPATATAAATRLLAGDLEHPQASWAPSASPVTSSLGLCGKGVALNPKPNKGRVLFILCSLGSQEDGLRSLNPQTLESQDLSEAFNYVVSFVLMQLALILTSVCYSPQVGIADVVPHPRSGVVRF